jgi:hypothetical protein
MFNLAFLLQQGPSADDISHIVVAMMAILPLIILICLAIIIIPFWFICKKAGFSPWLSLLCLIPSLGILILIYVLAFAQWKVVPAPQMAYPPPYPPPPVPPQLPPQQ